MKHTREPWETNEDFDGALYLNGANGRCIACTERRANEQDKADYARARACVNACAGLRPEGIQELVRAARKLRRWPEKGFSAAAGAVLAALAKVADADEEE